MRARAWLRGAVLGGLIALLVASLGQGPVDAVAPPARKLTPQQRERLKERDPWRRQALALARAGRLEEALEAGQKVLAIERAVFGDGHEEVAGSLRVLAFWHEA